METSLRVLGQEHPDALTSMNNLTFTWKSQGRDHNALGLIKECLLLTNTKHQPVSLCGLTKSESWSFLGVSSVRAASLKLPQHFSPEEASRRPSGVKCHHHGPDAAGPDPLLHGPHHGFQGQQHGSEARLPSQRHGPEKYSSLMTDRRA